MPLPQTRKIPRSSARDMVYARLRDWIVRGPLEPGETIRDVDVAARLGVSRTPVREALVRLEQDGLVEFLPGRWTRVAQLRYEEAEHLYAVGGALDALAARLATERLTERDLGELERAIGRLQETPEPSELQSADEEFHDMYMRVAGNPVLSEMFQQIVMELRRLERVNFRDPLTPDVAYREHAAILAGFRARDPERAARAALANWMNAWPRVRAMLDQTARADKT